MIPPMPDPHSSIHMAEPQLQAVLQFLRNNGLSESESALMKDVIEKSQLASSEFEKFFFPMVPPPLRIPSARQLEVSDCVDSPFKESSSDDEFVSLGSSTTEVYSSDFTNPYGIRKTRPTSQASSDRLSQFGTARDYPDFDMQNDLFWYKENDEDYYAMPPLAASDFDSYPSEDKYIMTVQTGDHVERVELDGSKENTLAFSSRQDMKDEANGEFCDLDGHFQLKKKCDEHSSCYDCLDPLCACCGDSGRVFVANRLEYGLEELKVIYANDAELQNPREELLENDIYLFAERNCSTYDLLGCFDNAVDSHSVEKDDETNKNDSTVCDEAIAHENDEGSTILDELLMHETQEDNYEIFHLRIIHRKNRTGFEERREFPIVMNSVIAHRYYVTEFLGSAAFSKVVQARDLHSGKDVCLKIIKNDKGFFDQSLDEIKLLKLVNKHDPTDKHHILRLYDYFYYQEHLFIVTELLRSNLYEFQKYNRESGGKPFFTLTRLQAIARQCLEALLFLHDLGIIHCDLKPENILIKSYRRCEIKVIDLGSSCFQTDNLSLYVQSRSYRAPEVILGLPYDQKIDLWSLGCILAELCSGEVLFPNRAVAMILADMIAVLGPIDMDMLLRGQETNKYFTEEFVLYCINEDTNEVEYVVPEGLPLERHLGISEPGFIDFLKCLLEINPKRRPNAREALQHPWLAHSYEVSSSRVSQFL